ncbi:MAG: thioredoxin-dependent thiol peroxidase [Candidatus Promineifilaceae bacterium]|nr:thioredoxin-dependent thiol peroxidase [Candidatus Promineifilaceae bacterium]
MPEVGQMAPDFTLVSDEGKEVSLSDLRGQRVILFFYPRAATPGCTRQACGFRDNWPQIEAAGAAIFGISPDSVETLAEWREEEKLPYPLLSDLDHEVAEQYGVWGEKKMFGRVYEGVIRSHFVVDSEGRLVDIQRDVSPEQSVTRALEAL